SSGKPWMSRHGPANAKNAAAWKTKSAACARALLDHDIEAMKGLIRIGGGRSLAHRVAGNRHKCRQTRERVCPGRPCAKPPCVVFGTRLAARFPTHRRDDRVVEGA